MKTLLSRRLFLSTAVALLSMGLLAQAKSGWSDDYDKSLAEAKTSGKMVLLDFTGSDWCPWCIKMDKEVLEQKAFKDYAKDSLVLVELDFPRSKKLRPKIAKQNEALQEKFKVQGFPSYVLLDSNGNVLKQLSGYQQGGPEKFVETLKAAKK